MKKLRFVSICILIGIICAMLNVGIKNVLQAKSNQNYCKKRLAVEMVYDKQIKKSMLEMQDKGIYMMLYGMKKHVKVVNEEFNRNTEVTVYRIAGNSAVLFQNANAISYDDVSSCIIGKKAALSLFGSMHVTGRLITIGDTKYKVAGIEYHAENILIRQANPFKSEKLTHAAYSYQNQKEKFVAEQTIKNMFG